MTATRILVVMPSIPVQGMERANLRIMQMMRKRGADVLFITEQQYGGLIQQEVERIGCKWVPAPFAQRLHVSTNVREMASVFIAWWRAMRRVRRICGDYQPTHIYVTNLSFFLSALTTVYRASQPVVFRLPNPPDTQLSPWKQQVANALWRLCIAPTCDVIVCNSRYTRSQLKTIGVETEKVQVIYNAVPEHVCTGPSDAPAVNPEHWNVAYLGRIQPEKGVRELFDVALRIAYERQDVDFYLVGEDDWQNPFAAALRREVSTRGLQARIRFTGEIEDVFAFLARCDLHVCPSVSPSESLPNVVLEAKSQGLPSVVFPVAGLTEIITHRVDGYICRQSAADELYEGIQYYLEHPATLRAAGVAAQQSLGRFCDAAIADAWAAVFKTI